MHGQRSRSDQMVFFKTEKGHEEVAQRRFGLDMRQRRVLIMMDGKKTLSALQEMMTKDGLENIIAFLVEQGFADAAEPVGRSAGAASFEELSATEARRTHRAASVQQASASRAPKHVPATAAKEVVPLRDVRKIRQVKDFMTTTATTYLGLLSADVVHRIERADSAEDLLNVVGSWHMALRESKHGNRFAGPYLDQVTGVLNGGDAQLEVT